MPTFLMNITDCAGGSKDCRPCASMSASRCHPLPVLIWTTRGPVARIRSVCRTVS